MVSVVTIPPLFPGHVQARISKLPGFGFVMLLFSYLQKVMTEKRCLTNKVQALNIINQ